MENKENGNNVGCIILFIIAVVAYILYSFHNTTSDEFAELGEIVMFIVSGGIVYLIVKRISNKSQAGNSCNNTIDEERKSSDNKGCIVAILFLLGILALFALIFNFIGTDYDFNRGVGIFVMVVAIIAGAYFIWQMGEK